MTAREVVKMSGEDIEVTGAVILLFVSRPCVATLLYHWLKLLLNRHCMLLGAVSLTCL